MEIVRSLTDDEREAAIAQAYAAALTAETPSLKRYWNDQMTNLIHGRSQAAIAKLERAKGLRAA